MAKTISDFAIRAIQQDSDLFNAVAGSLEIKHQTLTTMLSKKKAKRPRRFLEYDCVIEISKSTGKEPEQLIEREYALTT